MRNLDLAARILLYFVDLFTSSANDFRDNSEHVAILSYTATKALFVWIKIKIYVHILTEADHAIGHSELLRHCRGSNTKDR